MDRIEQLEAELSEVDAEIDRHYEKVNRRNKICFRIVSVVMSILAMPFIVLLCLAMTAVMPIAIIYAGFTAQPKENKKEGK